MKPTSAKAAATKTPSCGGLLRHGEDQQDGARDEYSDAAHGAHQPFTLSVHLIANTRNRIVHSGQTLILDGGDFERSIERSHCHPELQDLHE